MTPKPKRKLKSQDSWKTVKIEGNVVSEDGGGLEGFIGLEVLESYPKNIVKHGKKTKKQIYAERKEAKREAKKRKAEQNSDSEINSSDESDGDKPEKKKKAKKSKQKVDEHVTSGVSGYYPGKYVLLRPPVSDQSDNEEDEEPLLKEGLEVDDLLHWNGLGVPEPILKAIAELGFKSPTEIQSLTLPAAVMGKKDILGAAETGSGKTLAFGIPILAGIMELKRKNAKSGIRKVKKIKENRDAGRDNLTPPPEELEDYPEIEESSDQDGKADTKDNPLYALVLTPTRELAVQVRDHIVAIAKFTGVKVAAIFGGLATVKQERVLRQCPEIVVATPGRLWELLEMGNAHLNKLEDISFLVIDETDRMVEKGHFEELHKILERLNLDERKRQTRQNFIFSATLTLVHDLPDHLQKRNFNRKQKFQKQTSDTKIQSLIESLGISQPKIVDITRSNQTAQNLTECRLICPIDRKDYYLYYFLQRHPGRTIVFCNSIGCVKRLAQLFSLLNCEPLPLHANMIQKQRLKNLEKFRKNPAGLLVATDVAARGLDIPDVQHVIHYQVPRTSENYVHRSGRTARANKDGITIMIMEPGEVKNYLKLCKTLDRREDLPLFPVSDRHLSAVKERVNLARDIDVLELKSKRESSEIGWLKKSAEEMDIVLEHEDITDEEAVSEDDENVLKKNRDKRLLITKRQQLQVLLGKPLFPKGFSFRYPTSGGNLESSFPNVDENGVSAIKVVKDAIQESKEAKKRRNKKTRMGNFDFNKEIK